MAELVSASKRYGDVVALHEVSLAIEPGEFVCIQGPSGSGKTTLTKLLYRELRPTTGQVFIEGQPVHDLPPSKLAGLRRRLGVVFEDHKLLPRLSALENVAFAVRVTDLRVSEAEARYRAMVALRAMGLEERAKHLPRELSQGQRQRVAIARAVVTQPRLLIADEPTENLDHETAQEIVDRLEDVAEGGTAILLVTHSLDVMRRLRRRMLTLAEGRLVDDQPAVAASRDLFVLEPVH